ncbi:MAG: hypothetical protein KGJ10_07580 [Acidobacteriota bacterium]|nr:hypothetical protein [Acidobacteriota bacterium]MDE3108114.1 hypothetical protein [Acidobacteriota bacterium]MDE3222969.1 hypothetical protein [Acidobacteriota bacterium]
MSDELEVSISCGSCVRRSTPDCADCLVSFVLGETPDELTLTHDEAKVLALFSNEGLVPSLRYRAREAR